MRHGNRRAVIGGAVLVVVALATVGVTMLGPGRAPAPGPETGVGLVDVVSSTRGALSVAVTGEESGGRPFDPGGQAESVIGDDGRTWLRDRTTEYPNAAIGRLDFRQRGASYWCTATLIDADTALTAGHCVHEGGSAAADGWSTRVRFSPGIHGNTAPFGSCGATELLTVGAWYRTGSEYQDLGLVQLDCEVGATVGWFGYRAVPGARGLLGVGVQVRGYPGDMVWGSLWTMADRIRVSQARMVFYQADTYGGQSGAPVFNGRGCNGVTGPCILAVHAYGVHGSGPHGENNHGPRLTAERVGLIAALAGEGN